MDIWHFERELSEEGFEIICGVDEAGRGPLAGDVYAAAVILPFDAQICGLDDSKKITEKNRDRLFDEIIDIALDYGIGIANHKEIDDINILQATFLAMNRAIDALAKKPDIALIDGNRDPGTKCRSMCVVGGDGKSASIAAASILAKVSRDRYMAQMAEKYPQYEFGKHKGYGTKLHYAKLHEFGPSEIHRLSFLKKLHKTAEPTHAQKRGKLGETLASEHLADKGYKIIAKNFHSPFGEIDIIAEDGNSIVFVEVKLRKNADFAVAREFVSKGKQDKITATANIWLSTNHTKLQPRFDVVEIYMESEDSKPKITHIENAF